MTYANMSNEELTSTIEALHARDRKGMNRKGAAARARQLRELVSIARERGLFA